MNAVIYGICGKMGHTLVAAAADFPEIKITGGVDAAGRFPGIPTFKCAAAITPAPDVIIDFSRPSALPDILSYALKNKVKLVLCTTGYSAADEESIKEASKSVAVFCSANMSVGVNLIVDLVAQAAKALSGAFDIEIVEKHHNLKADAPSGTALMLANAANEGSGGNKKFIYGRGGADAKRNADEICIHAIRGGTLPGEHDVLFIGGDEVITISHTAYSKKIFATGALRAALMLSDKENGLYSYKRK